MELTTNFDGSMLNTARVCLRRYFYNYVCNITYKKFNFAADFGTAIHEGLDSYYSTGDKEKALKSYITKYTELFTPNEGKETKSEVGAILNFTPEVPDNYTLAVGLRILNDYFKFYSGENLKVIQTEVGFANQISPGVLYGGRKDLVVEIDEETLLIIDHKTTSRLGTRNQKMGKPNAQLTGYSWDEMQWTEKKIFTSLNWIKVLKTKSDFFRTHPQETTVEDVMEWKKATIFTIKQILECAEREFFPAYTGVCFNYFGECEFTPLCRALKDPMEVYRGTLEGRVPVGYSKNEWEPFEGFRLGG